MRNLTAPKQYEDQRGSSFDAGCEGLVLFSPAGDKMRLHVGSDGFLYINDMPFGVQGMPPALHAPMHAEGGGDPLTPAMIGAVAKALLTAVPKAGGVPVLGEDGTLNPAFIAGLIDPAHHALSHAAGGSDAITPASILAVSESDPRLSDKRSPLDHAGQHAKGQTDAVTPASIGAVPDGDTRLTNARTPLPHNASHHKNGPDPISWDDVGAVDAELLTVRARVPGGVPQLNDIGHIDVNLLPQFALRPALHADTHAKDGVDRVTPLDIGAAERKHDHDNADILSVDAGKITSGVLDIARLPASAVERLFPVLDRAAMLALTISEVQNGDSVKILDENGLLFLVVDDAKLGTMDAFTDYSVGHAASVPWSGVEGKPETFRPENHAARHHAGGVDAIAPADIGAPTLAQHGSKADKSALAAHESLKASIGGFAHVKLEAMARDGSATAAPGGFGLGSECTHINSWGDQYTAGFFQTVTLAQNPNTTIAQNPNGNDAWFVGYVASHQHDSWATQHVTDINTGERFFRAGNIIKDVPWTALPIGISDGVTITNSRIAASATAVKTLNDRLTALEAAAVTSTNIRSISGVTLPDGVGSLQFQPK